MSSGDSAETLDLDRDLPTTPAEVAALRRVRRSPVTLEDYLRFLAALEPPPDALRRRPGPCGEPFSLTG